MGVPAETFLTQPDDHSGNIQQQRHEQCRYKDKDPDRLTRYEWLGIIFSGLTFVAVAITAGIYYGQLQEMQKSNKATLDAVASAQESVSVARDTAKRQLRAYVGFDNISVDDSKKPGEMNGIISISMKNFGLTPAHSVHAGIMVQSFWKKSGEDVASIPPVFTYPMAPLEKEGKSGIQNSRDYIEPGRAKPSYSQAFQRLPLFTDEILKSESIYVYGEIRYTDIYETTYVHDFCYLYVPENVASLRLVTSAYHNTEREEK